MGLIAVESQQNVAGGRCGGGGGGRVEQLSGGDKDKKKKRRSNRRQKQNSPTHGSACGSPPEQYQVTPSSLRNGNASSSTLSEHHGLPRDSNVAFNSLPALHIGDLSAKLDSRVKVSSRSCPLPISCDESVCLLGRAELIYQQKCFDPHWSKEDVDEALQRGEVFQATFRVNAHNRLEAYCTIDGAPVDVLISGIPMQNRAVEGDIVAVKVDPPHLWTRMKGSAGLSIKSAPAENDNLYSDDSEIVNCNVKGINAVEMDRNYRNCVSGKNCTPMPENELRKTETSSPVAFVHPEPNNLGNCCHANGHSHDAIASGPSDSLSSVEKLCKSIIDFPSRRPTGKVIGIIESSPRRDSIVGFLDVKQWLVGMDSYQKDIRRNKNSVLSNREYIWLWPTDPRFPNMMVPVEGLPDSIRERLDDNDEALEKELMAAQIVGWEDQCPAPEAQVLRSFGQGGEMEPQIAAILFENTVCSSEFSPEALSCLPEEKWEVPQVELEKRKDIRKLCIFTIDPSTATDLDDALSVEMLPGDIYRVGVHIADVSYFVQPDTALDLEAQIRSTSVYMLTRKLPMLPPLLSEDLGSLIPGVDRLAFSIFWDINLSGTVVDLWIGRTVMRSCCKLSYEHAHNILIGEIDHAFPQVYGNFEWQDIVRSVRSLYEIAKALKEKRFRSGALSLESPKVVFLLDDDGIPYDSTMSKRSDSNFLVEEFMLLANRTAAEIISRTYPGRALLRRHPGPNIRKLRMFEAFCGKHGLQLNTSSSGSLHHSLENIKEKLKNNLVLYDILVSYASRPMQLARYFCSGDAKIDENDWGHYALAVPCYTHFTSPLRRFPDIVVHRTLSAAIEAEEMYLKHCRYLNDVSQEEEHRCFTGINFDQLAAESVQGQQALSTAASKHRVPCSESLADVAAYCNKRKLASRYVKDAVDKLYMWLLLKNKEVLISEARVVSLGPRFMSIYVHKLAIERQINYDEVEELMVEWLEATSTLVLSFYPYRRAHRRGSPGKFRALEDMALVVSPCNISEPDESSMQNGDLCNRDLEIEPALFPLTLQHLSKIPVALHAVGGDDGPLDIGVRLYMSSYFK